VEASFVAHLTALGSDATSAIAPNRPAVVIAPLKIAALIVFAFDGPLTKNFRLAAGSSGTIRTRGLSAFTTVTVSRRGSSPRTPLGDRSRRTSGVAPDKSPNRLQPKCPYSYLPLSLFPDRRERK
jgi:hypothetical protein